MQILNDYSSYPIVGRHVGHYLVVLKIRFYKFSKMMFEVRWGNRGCVANGEEVRMLSLVRFILFFPIPCYHFLNDIFHKKGRICFTR